MKLGIVIYSVDSEVVWNAFRLGLFAIKEGDSVSAFLLAGGVEAESRDTERFRVTEQMQAFADAGGRIMACGTCLKLRHAEGTQLCPLSRIRDLYEMIRDCDRTITF